MDINHNNERPVEKKSYEQCLTVLALKFVSIPHVTAAFLIIFLQKCVLNDFLTFVSVLRQNIVEICQGNKIPVESTSNYSNIFSNKFDHAVSAMQSMDTTYKVKETLYKHPLFVEPQSIVLGY